MTKFFILNFLILVSLNIHCSDINDPFDDGEEYTSKVDPKNKYTQIQLSTFSVVFGSESSSWTKFETKIAHFFLECNLLELMEFLKENKKQKDKECRNLLFTIFCIFHSKDNDQTTYFDVCLAIMTAFKQDLVDKIQLEVIEKWQKEYQDQVTKVFRAKRENA